MIEYGSLKGFLIKKGEAQKAIIWHANNLKKETKQCAIEATPQNSIALLLDNTEKVPLAKQYLKHKSAVQTLYCK